MITPIKQKTYKLGEMEIGISLEKKKSYENFFRELPPPLTKIVM